jgi:hypothetical protein
MVFNATFKNISAISWRSVLLAEETEGPGQNHRSVTDKLFYDRMVVGFTTADAINAYHHQRCEFESRSWRGVLDTTLCDKVCQ